MAWAGDALQGEERAATTETGYGWRRIDFALVLGPGGDIVSIERPPWRPRGKARDSSMFVPQRQLRTQGGLSSFLWGSSLHALGLRRWQGQDEVLADARSFHGFRAFQQAVFADTQDPSLRAFLRFLENWDPTRAPEIRDLAPLIGGTLAFRFRYDDNFLHETHAARLIWSRLMGSTAARLQPTEAA